MIIKFNNQQAKKEYRKLYNMLTYADKTVLDDLIYDVEEWLIEQTIRKPLMPGDFYPYGVMVQCNEVDYAITLIAGKCDNCSMTHIEVLKVEQFILN